MATLKEIADLASVSVATASRVLNGSAVGHPVSVAVRTAVQDAARQLGYTPSAPARALRSRHSRIIGVIVSDILDPYFGEIARAVEIEAGKHGYATIITNANRDPEQERQKFALLCEHRASGIIFCGSDIEGAPGTARLARDVKDAIDQGTRVVALAPRQFESDRIVVDNVATAADLTSYLLGLGHTDIVFMGGVRGLTAAEQRIDGYFLTMERSGLDPRVTGLDGLTQESGHLAMRKLLAGRELPEAVLCSNDEVAIGALAALSAEGLHAPESISLAGIGGTRVGALFGLTTMTLPLEELGRRAATWVVSRETAATSAPVPPTHLRVSSTTAPRTAPNSSRD